MNTILKLIEVRMIPSKTSLYRDSRGKYTIKRDADNQKVVSGGIEILREILIPP